MKLSCSARASQRWALGVASLSIVLASAMSIVACSSDDDSRYSYDAGGKDSGDIDSGTTDSGQDAGRKDSGKDAKDAGVEEDAGVDAEPDGDVPAPTWTEIYTSYFAPSTLGHCANSSCHGGTYSGYFSCKSQSDCYNGLINKGLIDLSSPADSWLIDPSTSPVRWFNSSGPMPKDSPSANPTAAADIEAWVLDGAQDN